MKLNAANTDQTLSKLIGDRLGQLRLQKNLTQEQLAEQAGLGLRTVQRLELGTAATQLSGFLRVCRVLGLMDRFELLLPETIVSPLSQLKLRGKERQRATPVKPKPGGKKPWTWGETK